MREYLLFFVFALLSVLLESTLLSHIPSESVRFDLVFLAAVFAGIKYDVRKGFGIVLLLGLLNDTFTGAPFGTSAVSYMVVFLCIRVVVANIFLHSSLSRLFWVVVFSLLNQAVGMLVVLLVIGRPVYFYAVLLWVIPQALFNGLLGMITLPLLDRYSELKLEKITRPKGLVLK